MNTLEGTGTTKSCVRCGGSFPRSSNAKYCVSCRPIAYIEKHREYMIANREKFRDIAREYARERRKDPLFIEKIRVYQQKRYSENPEKFHETRKRWCENHPDKERERHIRWAQANPEKVRVQRKASRHKRRAVIRGSRSYTLNELNVLFVEQDGRCYYCNELLEVTHIDHKTPLSRGGSNTIDNIALSCPHCNLTKYNKTEQEFARSIRMRR
jgi:5-methylcytosine-specific restriction endonuclease McrA